MFLSADSFSFMFFKCSVTYVVSILFTPLKLKDFIYKKT
jgi:hypothetical protein